MMMTMMMMLLVLLPVMVMVMVLMIAVVMVVVVVVVMMLMMLMATTMTVDDALSRCQMLLQGPTLSGYSGALCPQLPPSEAPLAAALVLLMASRWSRGLTHPCSSRSPAVPASSSGRLYRSRYSKCQSRKAANEKAQQSQQQLQAAFGHVSCSSGPHLSPLVAQPAVPARPWSGLRMSNAPGTALVALMSRIHSPVSSSRLMLLQLVTAVPVMAVV